MKLRPLSIRGQLLLLVLALGVPFLAFLLVSTTRQASHDTALAARQMLGVARLTAARLDDHVGDVLQALKLLGAAVGTTPGDTAFNDALLRNLSTRLPPQTRNVAVWTTDGHNIGALDPAVRQAPGVGEMRDRRHFRDALAHPEMAVEAPVAAWTDGEMLAVFALRIERDGQVVGVVTLTTWLRPLLALLAPRDAGPPGSVVTVANGRGVVLARSLDPEKWVGRDLTTLSSTPASSLRLPREGEHRGRGADGVERIAGFTTAERVNWLVYVGVPKADALAPTQARLVENLGAGGAMMVVGLLLSAWLARRISLPLQRLEADARRLGQGELDHRSTVTGAAEIGALGSTLNEMAQALQQRNAALQASQDELADLYDNAPCGYHLLDAEGRFLRINNTALHWLGYTRDELLGQPVSRVLDDSGRAVLQARLPELLAQGRVKDLEFDLVCKTGALRRVVASTTAVRDADGHLLSTRTVVYDITELQRLRGDLQRLGEEQQALLDADLLAILKLQDRHVLWANAGVQRQLGYTPAELLGRSARVLHVDDAAFAAIGAEADAVTGAGGNYRRALQLRRKDGSLCWFDAVSFGLATSPGAVLVLLLDMTSMKAAEEARLQARTLEAQNRELAEASRLKNVFLANMSHELRTPMNAVLGYVHLLRSGAGRHDSHKTAGFLEQIDSSGRQLLEMIDTMLNMAQVESGRLDLEPRPLCLRTAVDEAVALLQPEAMKKPVGISVDFDNTLDHIQADPVRLLQVLTAYLSNAIKFSHVGGAVQLRVQAQRGGMFRLDVTDHGIGIAQADLPKLFTPFRQLSEGSRKLYGGAGLGLALVKRVVEAQGGSVGVHSTPGQGSVFWLVLPTGL